MAKEMKNKASKITKVSLVIYFVVMLIGIICSFVIAWKFNDWRILYGFLVCLGSATLFALVSICLPIGLFFSVKTKKTVFIYSLLYVLKYLILFIVPILALSYGEEAYFNRWAMLVSTLLAPITVVALKISIAIIDSKNSKKEPKSSTNSIKF